MVDYRTESELTIGKSDIMVKQRYAFRIVTSGSQLFTIEQPIPVRVAKARDKFGSLTTKLFTKNGIGYIQIKIPSKLRAGSVHAVEMSLLIHPELEEIGGLQILSWGSLNLIRIRSSLKPFQVLGFAKSFKRNNYWVFEDSLATDISANIARFRSSRVEFGSNLRIKLTFRMFLDCSAGGTIQSISTFGPTASKRQQTQLLPGQDNVRIDYDMNRNPRYVVDAPAQSGDRTTISIGWFVTVNPGPEITKRLGSMQALRLLLRDNQKYRSYLSGGKYWQVDHPDIKRIVGKNANARSIFDQHRFLFEFVNRHLKYTITNNRQDAATALISKVGDCSEFADLLVTLHRAAGIPSRVVEGIIIENDKETNPEGHAWVEFLTTKGWMPADPTWGITLGITGQHVEFAHQKEGLESQIFSMEFVGPQPEVNYELSWEEV